MILSNGHHYLTAPKMTGWVKRKAEDLDTSQMKEIMIYKTGEKVFAHVEKHGNEYYYFFYDEKRAKKDEEKRKNKLEKILAEKRELEKLAKKKGWKAVKRKLTKKKKVVKNLGDAVVTTHVTIQKRLMEKSDKQIEEEVMDKSMDGKFVLISSKEMSPKRALKLYRKKDKVEKLISDLKSVFKVRPFRIWRENEVKGCVLLKMISLLFIALLQLEFKELEKKSKKTIIDMIKSLTVVVSFDKIGRFVMSV